MQEATTPSPLPTVPRAPRPLAMLLVGWSGVVALSIIAGWYLESIARAAMQFVTGMGEDAWRSTSAGLAVSILSMQVGAVVIAGCPALFAGARIRDHLALTPPPGDAGLGVLIALGTVGVHFLGSGAVLWLGALGGASGDIPFVNDMDATIAGARGVDLLFTIPVLALAPAIGEEILFRGYFMRRLLGRVSPPTAISIAALAFALSHLHPTHALSVLPVGVWLGYVAWRTNSTIPAIVGHAASILAGEICRLVTGESGPLVQWGVYAGAGIAGVFAARAAVARIERLPIPPIPA